MLSRSSYWKVLVLQGFPLKLRDILFLGITLIIPNFRIIRISVQPGSVGAQKMTVTSGLNCLELYKKSGPLGSLVRTLLESSLWHSTRCFLTWKISATPRKRLLFRLAPSMPRTDGTGARLWPTVRSKETGGYQYSQGRHDRPVQTLTGAARMRPTPKARDWRGASGRENRQSPDLNVAVKMFPTPKAQNCRGNGERHGEGGPSLDVVVGGRLNPEWVEWLMGFPIGWTELNV